MTAQGPALRACVWELTLACNARCLHCGCSLDDAHGTTNPAGFGQFIAICRACDLYTWYDLKA